MQINKGWLYLAVPVSGFIISLFAFGNTITLLTGAGNVSQADDGETEVSA